MDRRHNARVKVDVLINRFLDEHPYMCRMTDISATGLRLVPLLEPSTAARSMGLQFRLPGIDALLTASAEAVDSANGAAGTGVKFTTLPPESASLIRRFVGSN